MLSETRRLPLYADLSIYIYIYTVQISLAEPHHIQPVEWIMLLIPHVVAGKYQHPRAIENMFCLNVEIHGINVLLNSVLKQLTQRY